LQRVASVGFASVLLASAIFAIGAAVITKQTLQDVSTANVLNALYQEARYEVGAEESLERKYRLEPSPEVRADHRAAERSLENAIRAVAAAGDAEDRLISVKVLKAHAGYVSATKLMFAAVDRNQPALALSLDHNKIDPVFGVVEASVFGEAADQRSETNVIVEHLKEIQSRVIALTVALSLLNLLFFIAYFWLLMTYRRRLGETHDVEIKALEEASLIDHLTNIGNHRAYQEDLRREASGAARHDKPLSLALIDIDDMKVVNDQNGHMHGDIVLAALGSLLRNIRAEDRPFRLGGDEFGLLLSNTSEHEAALLMERLRQQAKESLSGATISIGIASLKGSACETETLQAQADAALYAAKRAGRNSVVSFDESNDGMWLLSPTKVQQLLRLIADEAVTIAFQPIWDVEGCAILAYEALARPAKDYGFDGPQDAFDLAERVGRAHELDAVCRRATLRRAKELPAGVLLFINVSPQSLDRGRLNAIEFSNEVVAAGLTPQQVVIEITERSVAQLAVVVRAAKDLQRIGFRLALDDTGAGNAGLEMLSQLPVEFVKIDREIIVKAMTDKSARGVMAGIVAIARETGAYVIAEGIEDVHMLDLAYGGGSGSSKHRRGVHGVQGYLLQRPSELIPTPGDPCVIRDLLRATADGHAVTIEAR
jgi:diguanylate cyclase (GGDEF)-like protein